MERFAVHGFSKRVRQDLGIFMPAANHVDISKFGVGAKEAAFFLGDKLRVVSKTRSSEAVAELMIDGANLDRLFKENWNKTAVVYENEIHLRATGDVDCCITDEAESRKLSMIEEFRHHENENDQFTYIVVRLNPIICQKLKDSDKFQGMVSDLSAVHHFYRCPEHLPHACIVERCTISSYLISKV